MTYSEALDKLEAKGLLGRDAITAVETALLIADTRTIDGLRARVEVMTVPQIMRAFGADAGRAVLVLCDDL